MARPDELGITAMHAGAPLAPAPGGPGLLLARLGWLLIVLLAMGVFAAAIPARFAELQRLSAATAEEGRVARLVAMQLAPADVPALQSLGFSIRAYAAYHLAVEVAFALVCALVGVLLALRRSSDWMALLVALSLIAAAAAIPPTIHALVRADPAWRAPVDFVLAAYIGANIVIYLFPDGRFVPRWTRWPAALLIIWSLTWIFFPSAQPAAWPLVPSLLATLLIIGTLGFSQVYRFVRVSDPLQRQQTKWFVLGLSLGMVAVIVYDFNLPGLVWASLAAPGPDRLLFNLVSRPIYYAFRLLPPLAITIAILRYRLWDIDILINRTLVYGALTVVLGLVYLNSVVVLQQLFQPWLGQGNDLALVASTMAIAGLFQPVRRRIQAIIDRRFYRRKYDAAQTLQAFSARLRDDVDVQRLNDEIVAAVRETLQPAHLSLWLRPPEGTPRRHPRRPPDESR